MKVDSGNTSRDLVFLSARAETIWAVDWQANWNAGKDMKKLLDKGR